MRRRFTYALSAALLSPGAPIGLLAVRAATRRRVKRLGPAAGELTETAECVYVGAATAIVFAAFGWVIGCQADRLAELSETDSLTGLRNARGMFMRLEAELARCSRSREPLALLLIDLDDLKRVNDRYGHRAGDRTLRGLADVIRSQLRATDLGARWGGDEFAIVAPHTSREAAIALAERVRALIHRNVPLDLTASLGVAVIEPRDHEDIVDLATVMRSADAALYEAKRQGKDRIVCQPRTHTTPGHGTDAPRQAPGDADQVAGNSPS